MPQRIGCRDQIPELVVREAAGVSKWIGGAGELTKRPSVGESTGYGIAGPSQTGNAGCVSISIVAERGGTVQGIGHRLQQIVRIILICNGLLFRLAQRVGVTGGIAERVKHNTPHISTGISDIHLRYQRQITLPALGVRPGIAVGPPAAGLDNASTTASPSSARNLEMVLGGIGGRSPLEQEGAAVGLGLLNHAPG